MTSTRPLSITQACEAAGVSRRTIYNWLKDGRLAYKRTAGGSIRIDADSLFVDKDAIVSKRTRFSKEIK